MSKRLNITVSFSNHEELYDYVMNQPNSSYYIRKLVEEDMRKNKIKEQDKNDFDINELKTIYGL